MIKIEQFVSKFQEQYMDEEVTLTAESDFRQVDTWDSLTGMSILVMIKD